MGSCQNCGDSGGQQDLVEPERTLWVNGWMESGGAPSELLSVNFSHLFSTRLNYSREGSSSSRRPGKQVPPPPTRPLRCLGSEAQTELNQKEPRASGITAELCAVCAVLSH